LRQFRGSNGVREIVRLLTDVYGERRWRKHGSGVAGLVGTILSQNTSNANASAGMASLKRAFPTWEQVLAAPTARLERAIRCAGLSRVKAPRIKAALRVIQRHRGRLSLDFLARMPVSEARTFLEGLDGIGPKTACCVLLFCYDRPALPVDTHVHRVALRLGLIPRRCSAERAHVLLQAICPDELVYPFHVLLIEHGRRICRARSPRCAECTLRARCVAGVQTLRRAGTKPRRSKASAPQ
jgi:endonuclease-3